MPKFRIYQPVLFRLLHGAAMALTLLAMASGFWVYNTYDQRWGSIALPKLEDIQGIHGTIALTFLLVLPFFALYSFHLGHQRLVQSQSFTQLKQLGKPIGWISLQRCANTFMLLVATFAVLTGRMMKEEWLPRGEMNHQWYLAHLIAWVCVFTGLAFHLLLGAKVGGISLLLSMFNWTIRDNDTLQLWLRGIRINYADWSLKIIEIIVIGGIITAFILPVFNS